MSEVKKLVTAIVLDRENRALLWHRLDYNQWELPGGTLHEEEVPLQALARHFKTKLDLTVTAAHKIGQLAYSQAETTYMGEVFQVTGCEGVPGFGDELIYDILQNVPLQNRNQSRHLRLSANVINFVEAFESFQDKLRYDSGPLSD